MTTRKAQKKNKLRSAEYFDLQETLDRLYRQSQENHRFTSLMSLVTSEENILLAYRNISKNKGSKTAGTDGKTIRFLSGFTNDALIAYVRKRLEYYQPQAVRRVEIPKGDTGKTRPLGIPTIADRLIQQCFLQILEPICEAKFHERSNGFRPNRSAEHALAQCYAMIQKRELHFVVDIDIKGFFDNVSHGKLLKQMWNIGIQDKRLLSILGAYNAYVSGVHNYYRYATHISKDIRKIAFSITRTMKNRLRERLQMQGNAPPAYIAMRYGQSRQMRYVNGQALIPIGYIQTKAPLYKRREINQYTPEGRETIHKSLDRINIDVLHFLMRNPVTYASVELNSNRLALYCAQGGRCAITRQPLEIGNIHCHHKIPRKQGGSDRYSNLVLITEKVHILVHATSMEVIQHYTHLLQLNANQLSKLNTLRRMSGLPSI